jgi:hypothetical protein
MCADNGCREIDFVHLFGLTCFSDFLVLMTS